MEFLLRFSLKLNSIFPFALVSTSVLQSDETPTAVFGLWEARKELESNFFCVLCTSLIPKSDDDIKATLEIHPKSYRTGTTAGCQSAAVWLLFYSLSPEPLALLTNWWQCPSIGNRIYFPLSSTNWNVAHCGTSSQTHSAWTASVRSL